MKRVVIVVVLALLSSVAGCTKEAAKKGPAPAKYVVILEGPRHPDSKIQVTGLTPTLKSVKPEVKGDVYTVKDVKVVVRPSADDNVNIFMEGVLFKDLILEVPPGIPVYYLKGP